MAISTARLLAAGNFDKGTVFQIKPDGTEGVLDSFGASPSDGANPRASLIQGKDGYFYGTTEKGGRYGRGTVFLVTSNGLPVPRANVYSFSGSDGSCPLASLMEGLDGKFYGTTYLGGAHDDGTVFRFDPRNSTETVLHSFDHNSFVGGDLDGDYPEAGVVQGKDGAL